MWSDTVSKPDSYLIQVASASDGMTWRPSSLDSLALTVAQPTAICDLLFVLMGHSGLLTYNRREADTYY